MLNENILLAANRWQRAVRCILMKAIIDYDQAYLRRCVAWSDCLPLPWLLQSVFTLTGHFTRLPPLWRATVSEAPETIIDASSSLQRLYSPARQPANGLVPGIREGEPAVTAVQYHVAAVWLAVILHNLQYRLLGKRFSNHARGISTMLPIALIFTRCYLA